jgi:hypothetical protein
VTVDIGVSDAAGATASNGEVAVWVVDQAVLDLGGYALEDPISRLHRTGSADRPQSLLPHRLIRWTRKPLGPGILSAEVLDAMTGAPKNGLRVALDGTRQTQFVTQGTLLLTGVEPGSHHLQISRGQEPVMDVDFVMTEEGLDLGTLLVEGPQYVAAQFRNAASIAATGFESGPLELNVIRVTGSGIEAPATVNIAFRTVPDPELGSLVNVRELFRALATFQTDVPLDGEGKARVSFRLPDTSTRYRIFAVATHGTTRFGVAESSVTAAKDLVVRVTPPPLPPSRG